MSSLLLANAFVILPFTCFNQKITQKLPLKNTPSTMENARSLSWNGALSAFKYLQAHSAFPFTAGILSIALNSSVFLSLEVINVSIIREYVSL